MTSQQTSQRPTMEQITAALAALRDAARACDNTQHVTALANARALGCIDDQIHDAYRWGSRQRMTFDTHLPGVIASDGHGN